MNSYARTFFALWFAAMLLTTGFRLADDPSYTETIDQWHRQRVESLKSDTGWLNVAGLFWLEEGTHTLGRGTAFDVAFPAAQHSVGLGRLAKQKNTIRFIPDSRAGITADGKPVNTETVIFADDTKPVVLAYQSLRWFIIKRGDKIGVRLRDLDSPALQTFRGIARYPVDERWRVEARLEKPTQSKTIAILDVLGLTSQQPLAGTLVFTLAGKSYHLDAVDEGQGKLFILFGDATNARKTYGSGRFLYADVPTEGKSITLDFNQAINPPCAFTEYATCPLPPKQNRLTIGVTAGEKRYEHPN